MPNASEAIWSFHLFAPTLFSLRKILNTWRMLMMCALSFIFNGREISLPGKTVCKAQVATIWFTGSCLPGSVPGLCMALNKSCQLWVCLLPLPVLLHLWDSLKSKVCFCDIWHVLYFACSLYGICRNHQDQAQQGTVSLHTQFRHLCLGVSSIKLSWNTVCWCMKGSVQKAAF